MLAAYLAVTLTHTLRGARPRRPWQHTLFVLGADRLRGDTLDRLSDRVREHRDRAGPGLSLRPAARQAAARARERRRGLHAARQRRGCQGGQRAARHRAPLRPVPAHRDDRAVGHRHHGRQLHRHHRLGQLAGGILVGQRGQHPRHRPRAGPATACMPLAANSSRSTQTSDSRSTTEQRIGQHRDQHRVPPGARRHPGPPATASRWPSACSAPASPGRTARSCSSCRPAR